MAMLHSHDLAAKELQTILDEEDPKAFSFTESETRWRDMTASLEDIEQARELFVSYGSCSVEEPIEDLQKLGLLEGTFV